MTPPDVTGTAELHRVLKNKTRDAAKDPNGLNIDLVCWLMLNTEEMPSFELQHFAVLRAAWPNYAVVHGLNWDFGTFLKKFGSAVGSLMTMLYVCGFEKQVGDFIKEFVERNLDLEPQYHDSHGHGIEYVLKTISGLELKLEEVWNMLDVLAEAFQSKINEENPPRFQNQVAAFNRKHQLKYGTKLFFVFNQFLDYQSQALYGSFLFSILKGLQSEFGADNRLLSSCFQMIHIVLVSRNDGFFWQKMRGYGFSVSHNFDAAATNLCLLNSKLPAFEMPGREPEDDVDDGEECIPHPPNTEKTKRKAANTKKAGDAKKAKTSKQSRKKS
jgi:hypothetical protein